MYYLLKKIKTKRKEKTHLFATFSVKLSTNSCSRILVSLLMAWNSEYNPSRAFVMGYCNLNPQGTVSMAHYVLPTRQYMHI